MKSAKGQTIVYQQMAVGDIQASQRDAVFFSEGFPERKVERRVLGQIVRRGIPVCETRAVIHVRRCVGLPRETRLEPGAQRVSLIMIQR